MSTVLAATNQSNISSWLIDRFSTYKKLLRVCAWIKRFIYNSKLQKHLRSSGELSVEELLESELFMLKLVQTEVFANEKDKRLEVLKAFKDDKGLIRLKTRITERDDTYNFRYPIVLPACHDLVTLLIKEKHDKLGHAGVQILLNNLREDYWVLGGRKAIRAVLKGCSTCQRYSSKPMEVISAPLPLDRVRDAAIFEVTGVDAAGPIFLKGPQKAWIILFTCAVYRAVHLELVTSLSTVAFIDALRRFISRRGRPSIIYSDNGKNFVGLDNLLKLVDWQKVEKFGTINKIQWRFNPPSAAWWGGWWERLIGVLKRLLRRILKKACLSYEEMLTVLYDCEAVINSRPLTAMSDNAQDFVPLTPSMFLQEIKEVGVLDCDFLERCRLDKRFVYRQSIKDQLRSRFRIEYLGELMYHDNKRSKRIRQPQIGDIVLIGNDNQKRLDWPLARVTELILGKDNKPRVVRLKTASGELTRPVQRIYSLEMDDEFNVNKNVLIEKRKESLNSDCLD
ncbi:PREDICTED: uncharacterized protein LOC108749269 [Trachymyrmex septentrionalis]|uniref:uncharacterized protein LOC108749269 n=1 Tax=Trachymyrmex septentrionalis TaxID=34720 RepID=UPI00084F63C9|nr:PREDICTED: uncharacterized protein LOC108749269 [Trachymyrmex septentrionalis]